MAVVDVTRHVGRVTAELDGDVLAAGVFQLAVLSLAGTEHTAAVVNSPTVPQRGAGADVLLSTKTQPQQLPALELYPSSAAGGKKLENSFRK